MIYTLAYLLYEINICFIAGAQGHNNISLLVTITRQVAVAVSGIICPVSQDLLTFCIEQNETAFFLGADDIMKSYSL